MLRDITSQQCWEKRAKSYQLSFWMMPNMNSKYVSIFNHHAFLQYFERNIEVFVIISWIPFLGCSCQQAAFYKCFCCCCVSTISFYWLVVSVIPLKLQIARPSLVQCCPVLSSLVKSCQVLSRIVRSCPDLTTPVEFFLGLFNPTESCSVLSYPVKYCLILFSPI